MSSVLNWSMAKAFLVLDDLVRTLFLLLLACTLDEVDFLAVVDTFSFSAPTIDCGAAAAPPKEVKDGLGLGCSVFLGGL